MTTRLSEIKLEGNELQSYLETFNKDLEGNGQQTITLVQTTEDNDEDEEGTYFVDQSGNYYYQATKDSEPVLTEPPDGENIQFIVEEDDNSIENADNIEEQLSNTKSRKQNILTTKIESNEFDTMTFESQGENNDGEVSKFIILINQNIFYLSKFF